jgi:hypothetical protein
VNQNLHLIDFIVSKAEMAAIEDEETPTTD